MPEAVDLRFAFGLEPRRAVDYFRSKGYAITWNWEALAADAHARAFTVAKAMRMDVLETIRAELDQALAAGKTLKDFQDTLRPRLEALGWWGKQVFERPDGTGQLVQTGSPRRLETIYRTNLQSAYMAGRYRAFFDNREAQPYWQYVAVMDSRTRPAHAALNGRVFRWDDPIWDSCWPPNGYNCRCRVRALSQRDVDRKGLGVSSSGDDLTSWQDTDPKTGQIWERVSYKGPGMSQAFSPDRGFVANQALAADFSEVAIATKAEVLGARTAEALREVVTESWPAYTVWARSVMQDGLVQSRFRVVGYVGDTEKQYAANQGTAFATGAIEVEDRMLVGAKSRRWSEGDKALDEASWLRLPMSLLDHEAILWDPENRTVIYIVPGPTDATRLRIVVRPQSLQRRTDVHDSIRSAQVVAVDDVRGAIRGGRYEIIKGWL